MSVIGVDGYRTTLARPLQANESELRIPRSAAIQLNVIGVGNHTYLTIVDMVKTEVVRYDHVADWDTTDPAVVALPVTRDMAGLGRRAFAYGSCVEYRVTSFQLQDLIAGVSGGAGIPCSAAAGPTNISEDAELPTTIVGGRDLLLGNPAGFIEACPGKLVPYYARGV